MTYTRLNTQVKVPVNTTLACKHFCGNEMFVFRVMHRFPPRSWDFLKLSTLDWLKNTLCWSPAMCLSEISPSKCERCCCCAGVISLDCLHLLLLLFGASGLRCYEPAGHACCNSVSCYRIFSPATFSLCVAPQQVQRSDEGHINGPLGGLLVFFVFFAILSSDKVWELVCFIFSPPFHHKIAKIRILSQPCTRGNCAQTLLHKHRNNFK